METIMHRLNIASLVSAIMLSSTGLAQAEAPNNLNLHFMSKRTYHASQEKGQPTQPDSEWQGATKIANQSADDSNNEASVASKMLATYTSYNCKD
jgi:hypothetical protein